MKSNLKIESQQFSFKQHRRESFQLSTIQDMSTGKSIFLFYFYTATKTTNLIFLPIL